MKGLIKEIINKESYFQSNIKNETILSRKPAIYTFINPVSYLEARQSKDLFKYFDNLFIDGSILVLFIRLLYSGKVKRRSFDMTSVVPPLFNYCIENNKSLFFVAAKEDEIHTALHNIKQSYPLLNIIGYRNGFFQNKKEQEAEYDKLLSINPDFLIVGMGVIKQEIFLQEIKAKGYKGIGFTCGGFISQTAKALVELEVDYYPKWVDRYNLRFLFRMYKEKHTRKRYLKAAFIFPFIFFKDRFF